MYPQEMEAAGSTVLWRLMRAGGASKGARSHAIILPGGPPFTVAFFANDEMDRVENYDTMELAIFRADEIKRSLMEGDWKEDS
jgi:hypothetical protein